MMRKTLLLSKGQSLAYIAAGQGAPVVLIHGVGLRAEAWGPQIAALSQEHTVYALDMPGHGGSDPLPLGAELADYVDWAAEALATLGAAAVVGHSMGALIALGLAIEHPALVTRLALLNAVHRRDDLARAAVLARAVQIASGQADPLAPLARWFDADDPVRAQVADWLAQVDPAGYSAAYQAFATGDTVYASELARVVCPTLVLTGGQDANSTAEMAAAMARAIRNARLNIIAGHRHMVNLTAPRAVNAALTEWLVSHD